MTVTVPSPRMAMSGSWMSFSLVVSSFGCGEGGAVVGGPDHVDVRAAVAGEPGPGEVDVAPGGRVARAVGRDRGLVVEHAEEVRRGGAAVDDDRPAELLAVVDRRPGRPRPGSRRWRPTRRRTSSSSRPGRRSSPTRRTAGRRRPRRAPGRRRSRSAPAPARRTARCLPGIPEPARTGTMRRRSGTGSSPARSGPTGSGAPSASDAVVVDVPQ